MLKSLEIKNFRMLEDFHVPKLGRVNLIVGKNNSGKSTVLEALRIFAGNAHFSLLEQIASSHDEKLYFSAIELDDVDATAPFSDFFSGRRYPDSDDIAIQIGEAKSDNILQVQHGYYIEFQEEYKEDSGEITYRIRRKRVLKSQLDELAGDDTLNHALFIQKGDRSTMLRIDASSSRLRAPTFEIMKATPCSTIPTQFIEIDELADEWDKIALTDDQEIVKDALRIISSEFEDITFIRKEGNYRTGKKSLDRSAKVKLSNISRPVPLNSLGDGMLRILQLILKTFPAKGGFLLIDEFENGLHYSVQEKIWELLFDLAEKLDIQIFATTHSWDCIESFSKVAVKKQEIDGILFRVGKSARISDNGKVIATVFDETQLFNITQADVEVR